MSETSEKDSIIDDIREMLNDAEAMKIFATSEAGQNLISKINRNIDDIVRSLIETYKKGTHIDLIVDIAKIEASKGVLDELISAPAKVDELREALKEELGDEVDKNGDEDSPEDN